MGKEVAIAIPGIAVNMSVTAQAIIGGGGKNFQLLKFGDFKPE